jgi:hypothetical protein
MYGRRVGESVDPTRWRVVRVIPPGYPHAAVFDELAESLAWGLAVAGARVTVAVNQTDPGGYNVLLGAHLGTPDPIAAEGVRGVVYNLEPLPEAVRRRPAYRAWFRRWPVWDFAAEQVDWLRREGARPVWHVPVGWAPVLDRDRTPAQPPDIDVLFAGSLTPRRRAVLDGIAAEGLGVRTLFAVYGRERNAWLARSRLAVNCHAEAGHPLETLRLMLLWAQGTAVVSEADRPDMIPPAWREAAQWVSLKDFPRTCRWLVDHPEARQALAARGRAAALGMTWDHLRQVLPQVVTWWEAHGTRDDGPP